MKKPIVILVLSPILAAWAVGTLPTLAAHISVLDFRAPGRILTSSTMNIRFVDGVKFLTLKAAVDDCVVTNSESCIVVSTTLETFAENPFVNALNTNKAIRVYLGMGTWDTDVCIILPQKSMIFGSGRGDTGGPGTTIRASSSFSCSYTNGDSVSRKAVIILGDAFPASHGVQVHTLLVDANCPTSGCSSVTDIIGIYSETINEHSGLFDFRVTNFDSWGIFFESTATGTVQNFWMRDIGVSRGFDTLSIGIEWSLSSANGGRLTNATVNGVTSVLAACYKFTSAPAALIEGLHGEDCIIVYDIETSVVGNSLQGAATCTTLVDLDAGVQDVALTGLRNQGCTNVLVDNAHGITDTANYITQYIVGDGTVKSLITDRQNIDLIFNSGMTINENGNNANDFRVETDTKTHAIFADSANNCVGILDSTCSGGPWIKSGPGAPTSTNCDSAAEIGRLWLRTDGTVGDDALYVCESDGAGGANWVAK